MDKTVRYHGIIKSVDSGHLQVGIVQSSACGGCSIKGHCSSAESKERLVDVYTAEAHEYQLGQDVWLLGSPTMGWKALWYGIALPFIVVFASLIIFTVVLQNDLWAALGALAMLIPYYYVIYRSKNKLQRELAFQVTPFER